MDQLQSGDVILSNLAAQFLTASIFQPAARVLNLTDWG
jgi:hypothetical protein